MVLNSVTLLCTVHVCLVIENTNFDLMPYM